MSAEQAFLADLRTRAAEVLELLGIAKILKEIHRMAINVDALKADFEQLRTDLNTKLAELRDAIAAQGTIPADVQAKLDALDEEINAADLSVKAPEQTGTAPGSPEPAGAASGQATVPATDTVAGTAADGIEHPDGSIAPPADSVPTTAPGPAISQNEQLSNG
jgi:uncharacterized coiled-coil protein SlyX